MTKKNAIYSGFVAASLAEAAIFITATSYIQMAAAILLYIPLAYFAFKLFPRKSKASPESTTTLPIQEERIIEHTKPEEQGVEEIESVEIFDIDKRAFLKLIGVTGLSFFISSLFSKRVETQILGKPEEPGPTTIQDPIGNIINPAKHQPTDNYKISEVDFGINTFYGFIDRGEGWFIMKEDMNAGTYRYLKGDTNFHDNWNNRENLKYDYFNRVFSKS